MMLGMRHSGALRKLFNIAAYDVRNNVQDLLDVMGRGMKAQLKAAANAGADYAVIVGKE